MVTGVMVSSIVVNPMVVGDACDKVAIKTHLDVRPPVSVDQRTDAVCVEHPPLYSTLLPPSCVCFCYL